MNNESKHKAGATDEGAGRDFGRRGRTLRLLCALAGCLIAAPVLLAIHPAHAQSSGGGTLDQILQTLQGNGGSGGGLGGLLGTSPQSTAPNQTVLQPAIPVAQTLPPSRLEQIMSTRAGTQLLQFGYDQFGSGSPVAVAQVGSIQDKYILGPGDEVIVSLRGQENNEYRTAVDRDGNVILPRLNPIPAAGRTLGQFRDDLVSAVRRAYVATQAFVSLGDLRQISVSVTGEVNAPGMRIVSGLSTVADAILISGGVKKTGSLRNIRILRGGRVITYDLYSILTQHGGEPSVNLVDGDRIVVPPLGHTVAIAGWVRRPGIFELAPGRSAVSVQELLSLGGGLEVRGRYRLTVMRIRSDGRMQLEDFAGGRGEVRDGEILFALPAADQTESQAVLSGGSVLAGKYAVNKATRLSEILKAPGALGQSPYTLFAIVVRKDPVTLLKSLVAVTPVAVLNGTEDLDLTNGDVVRVFSVDEARLISAVVKAFEDRRAAAGLALRAPASAQQQIVSQQQYVASLGQSGGTGAAGSPQAGIQIRPNTEREDIGELSTLVLGDTGLVQPGAANNSGAESPQAQPAFAPSTQGSAPPPLSLGQQYPQGQQYAQGQMQGSPYVPGQTSTQPSALSSTLQGLIPGSQPQAPPVQVPIPSQPPLAPNLQQQMVGPNQVPTNQEVTSFGDLSSQLGIDALVLVHFMMDHEVDLDGAVQGPGKYIVGPDVTLQDLVIAAGGTAQWADRSGVQVTTTDVDPATGGSVTQQKVIPARGGQLAAYIVKPHDDVRFNQIFTNADIGTITVQGEVRRAGVYQIVRGEHLSDLLQQAGGLTDVAYPYGAIFLRRSAAELEREGYRRTASEIQDQLLLAMTRVGSTEKLSPDAFAAAQSLVTQLRNQTPLGRISVVADPVVLATKPEVDPLLEDGDVLYVPQRPSTVSVLGEVMQPGGYLYASKKSPSDYIDHAGGYTAFADDSMTFVVLPDGTARSVQSSWFQFSQGEIPPGSAIVVPRDLSPFDMRQFVIDTSQVFSQLAIAAASIAVLSRNNN